MEKKKYIAPHCKVYAVQLESVIQTSPGGSSSPSTPQSLSFGGDDSSLTGPAVSEARERSSFAPDSPWEQIW